MRVFTQEELAAEEWRPVPIELFSQEYEVSSLGRVRRAKNSGYRNAWKAGRFLSLNSRSKYGHVRVNLYKQNTMHATHVHTIVAIAFIGPKPTPTHEVRHLNGDATDNRAANLAWGSSKDNTNDSRKHGTFVEGEKHPHAKITEEQVKKIRALRKQGYTTVDLAKMFGVGRQRIGKICRRLAWKHVEDI